MRPDASTAAPPRRLRSELERGAFSFFVDIDADGLAYERVVFDLAAEGIAVRSRDDAVGGRWRLLAAVADEAAMPDAVARLDTYFGPRLLSCDDEVMAVHRGGKVRVVPTVRIETPEDLALVYTPGVARVARRIALDPAAVDELTGRSNTIAIVTDGTAVLGLGDLGPAAALPVMEGKAALFARLAGINAIPLCLGTTVVDEIVAAVNAVAPTFAGINLEDIAAPRCFDVEARLRGRLPIPVFHDDQHGTAVVVLAALRNSLRLVGKQLPEARIVVSGAGAAGTAVTKILLSTGASDIVVWRPGGVLHDDDHDRLPPHKRWLANHTNPRGVRGGLAEAVGGADVFIGVSGPGVLTPAMVATMADAAIVFAMANPMPEIAPEAIDGMAAVVATGRSDYPNQINNVLAFPGIFRGALDAHAAQVTEAMKLAAATALAALAEPDLSTTRILPDVLDPRVVPAVAAAVAGGANTGQAPIGAGEPR